MCKFYKFYICAVVGVIIEWLNNMHGVTIKIRKKYFHFGSKQAFFSLYLGAFAKLRKATISFVICVRPSVRPHGKTRLPLKRVFMKFDIWVFFEKLSTNFKFHWNRWRTTVSLHKAHYTFFIISRSILLRMRTVSDKICTGNQNTHFVFSNVFPKIMPLMR